MSYSKEDIKDNIDLDDVYDLLDALGAEPQMYSDYIVALTICHSGDSHKLYYYENTQLFNCYTNCNSFDVIELVQKVKCLDLNSAIYYLVNFFNLQWRIDDKDDYDYSLEDWKIFDRQNKIAEIQEGQETFHYIDLPRYDDKILTYYPQPLILSWKEEGIEKNICDYMNIHYDPTIGAIIIPHYDENNKCVGIRQRTLLQEQEKYGKYMPWRRGKIQYNHPLGFNCFGLNWAKDNIRKGGIAIVVESEKAVAQYMSWFQPENNICVAVCGNSLSKYQFESLQRHGAKEIVIAFDKDYEDIYDIENYEKFLKKLTRINEKFGAKCTLSFIIDTKNLLGKKCSPTDRGKEIFLELFRNRLRATTYTYNLSKNRMEWYG